MANYKYKLKELEVGDTEIRRGKKSTVTNIDPETGQITWSIEDVPAFDSSFKKYAELRDYLKDLAVAKKDDSKFVEFYKNINNGFNEFRSYLRKNYPIEYETFKSIAETSTTGGNSGFTSGTEGENYATPFAFNPNKKAKGAAVNYYYKLGWKPAPKPHSSKTIDIIKEAETNVEEYIKSLNIESPALQKHITDRVLGFNKVETKLNELIPLLAKAKQETLDYYRQNPNFSVMYGTDLAVDYIDDLIEMFKKNK
jgi:hypothetical protein